MYRIYAIIILTVLLLLSAGSGIYLYKEWRKAERQVKEVIKLHGNTNKQLETYINRYNNTVVRNESIELELSTLKRERKEGNFEELKQFKGVKKNSRNVESITSITGELRGTLTLPMSTDSTFSTGIASRKFTFDDTFNSISGEIKDDSLKLTGQLKIPLSVVVLWDRKWFLGRKTFNAEGYSPNKNFIIVGLENIQIRRK